MVQTGHNGGSLLENCIRKKAFDLIEKHPGQALKVQLAFDARWDFKNATLVMGWHGKELGRRMLEMSSTAGPDRWKLAYAGDTFNTLWTTSVRMFNRSLSSSRSPITPT